MKVLLLLCGVVFAHNLFATDSTNQNVTVTLNVNQLGRAIPSGFVGFSREWGRFPFPDSGAPSEVHPTYLKLLSHLCAFNKKALSIRMGGASADGIKEAPDADRWSQLAQIYQTTHTPLIITINLASGNVQLAKDWIKAAQAGLPTDAIEAFELGNEPDGWFGKHKPQDYKWETYYEDFHAVAKELVPSLVPSLAGPAWAHGVPPEVMTSFLEKNPGLISMLTGHAYCFSPKNNPKPFRLLTEEAVKKTADFLADGITFAHNKGLKVRLGETGSAWGGGVAGFSDTFAASLWTLDFCFTLADSGLDGINFHNVRMNPYSAIKEDVDKKSGKANSITANSPYYGLLVFAEAVANEARLLPPIPSEGQVKLWATVDKQGVCRVVAINKSLDTPADLTLRTSCKQAALKRLEAPSHEATSGIHYAGQTFDGSTNGDPIGALKVETITSKAGTLSFHLAPASAALLKLD